jgi:hypothetical protein
MLIHPRSRSPLSGANPKQVFRQGGRGLDATPCRWICGSRPLGSCMITALPFAGAANSPWFLLPSRGEGLKVWTYVQNEIRPNCQSL